MPKRSRHKDQPVGKKKNPNSLTLLLLDIRQDVLGLSKKQMAELLSATSNVYSKTGINPERIAEFEDNEAYLRYIHIEKYAHALGIAAGLLLLFSRMIANELRDTGESNRNLAKQLTLLFGGIANDTKFAHVIADSKGERIVINVDELKRWMSIFGRKEAELPLRFDRKKQK